jgi:hypothetical protein
MSDPQSQQKPAEANRITSVRFTDSAPFGGESLSVTISSDVSAVPSRLDPDGRAAPIEKGQIATGLTLTRKYQDRGANKVRMERVYIPMSMVRGIVYGE